MNHPTPAIVAQHAVRRLPRLALLLLCVAYVLPGFIGRQPWKNADMASFGTMAELANGVTSWLTPQLVGQAAELDALLPYWLGALAIQWLPWLDPATAARVPFALLLAITLVSTWYAVYHLARAPQAQPVAFAFGGEANPADYARAVADGGLLALIACLGLAQLSHETTPSVAQLAFVGLTFYAVAASQSRRHLAWLAAHAGLIGLALSGAPTTALVLGGGSLVIGWITATPESRPQTLRWLLALALATLAAAVAATLLGLWRWRVSLPGFSMGDWPEWRSLGRLLVWFTWPAWPLAVWTVWRWRHRLSSRHVALPLWFVGVSLVATLITRSADRSLLLALPALAALAAFALPTLRRSMSALIDWFTLLFFSGCAIVIWVIWIAMQTGFPSKPAANVVKQVPGFEPSFSLFAFLVALSATLAWAWLVRWRVGRHRTAIWKSLVLPAGGAVLGWLLLMTLWLPPLDFARSYSVLTQRVATIIPPTQCAQIYALSQGQAAALRYHAGLQLAATGTPTACPWLIVNSDAQATVPVVIDMQHWTLQAVVRRPSERYEDVLIYRRVLP